MDTQVKQTNTTEATATLSHADIVKFLGLAVMMATDLPRDLPGTTISAELVPVEGSDQFVAKIGIVIDHTVLAPPIAGPGDASLNSGGAPAPDAAIMSPIVPTA